MHLAPSGLSAWGFVATHGATLVQTQPGSSRSAESQFTGLHPISRKGLFTGVATAAAKIPGLSGLAQGAAAFAAQNGAGMQEGPLTLLRPRELQTSASHGGRRFFSQLLPGSDVLLGVLQAAPSRQPGV